MKATEHLFISNYALSLSYSFATRTTTALLFYTNAIPPNLKDGVTLEDHITQLKSLLSDKPYLWAHPMYLPAVLLYNQVRRAQLHLVHDLDYRVMDAEATLGVTKLLIAKTESGATKTCLPVQYTTALQTGPGFKRKRSIPETKVDIRQQMVRMNSDSAASLFLLASLTWQTECVILLKDCLKDITPCLAPDLFDATQELGDFMEFMSSAIKNLGVMNDQMRARFQAQSRVVSSVKYWLIVSL